MSCRVDLIIFDLDGTLVDSRKDIVDSVNYTLRELSLPEKSFETIGSYIGTGVKDLLSQSIGQDNGDLLERSLTVFEEYYKEHATDQTSLYPHVKEVLDHFSDKKMLIVTNRRKSMTHSTLHKFGIDKYFPEIIGGDDDSCLKPRSCPIDKGLVALSEHKDNAIMVGDMDLDIIAGKRAGVLTCGATYGMGSKEDILKADPDFVIDDISELKDIIK